MLPTLVAMLRRLMLPEFVKLYSKNTFMVKPIYFISDAHLGSLAIESRRTQERRLVNFLDSIKYKAAAVYMLGDMFDFWYEYRTVVPKGYTRFLGKLSELTDMGVEVHYFLGNHDIWAYNYLAEECGVQIHRNASETLEIYGQTFLLGHGDGLGRVDSGFRILRSLFHSRLCQRMFSALHPRWGVAFGMEWARRSRLKRTDGQEPPYMGENEEPLCLYAKEYIKRHPDINFFIFGHRHIELDLMLSRSARMIILGDWISQFTFARYDGKSFVLDSYLEGETEP